MFYSDLHLWLLLYSSSFFVGVSGILIMVEDKIDALVDIQSAEELLLNAQDLVLIALHRAREVKGFSARWKTIITKLELVPACLSDLSSHPYFSKNTLCNEYLQANLKTLNEAIALAEMCGKENYRGRLQMQSDLDALSGKLDMNFRDCGLLIKTGILGEVAVNSRTELEFSTRELLTRLQIGHLEAKHKALDGVLEIMQEDIKKVSEVLGRSNIAALVHLLTATSQRIREKTVSVICRLADCKCLESWLVEEGVLPPLIRIVESGSAVGKKKATLSLQRLSVSVETARSIVEHNGVRPLIEICQTGDSVTQAAAACTLKNLSAVPEVRQSLAEEGIIKLVITLLDCGILPESRDHAAKCLQNLTSTNNNLRKLVISEGGIPSLLAYLDVSLPQDSAVGALRNLIGSVSVDNLVSADLIPRLVQVLKSGSLNAQKAAATAICRVCSSIEMKKMIGEAGCIPLLVKMLDAKSDSAKEIAAQAISSLMTLPRNCRELKQNDKALLSLVQLLEPSPQNTAKKYAVSCLVSISSSKKCKKLMISYGAIGYLKKLSEMDIPGAKKLLERLERKKLRSLFSRR
ncbi:protein CELLULOSE SYNTHASE INTERACTIVE 1 isoform X1 [Daucus carota subsp. sativus]|nr:PREDICTED: uncharacterized protein LOC108196839 isoform X2 [Daucus carota subsp. sativus]XP_017219783.1 PREDICTED: uncharacterized protein LOC108196839 isoform X2 [Daucus carota subsp. sativus]